MKKRINKNREKLSSEEIAKQRDFGSLLKQAGSMQPMQKPFYKTWGFISGASAVLVASVATVIYLNVNAPVNNEEKKNKTEQTIPQGDYTYNNSDSVKFIGNKPFINPPFKNADKKFTSYKVNSSAPKEITYPTGTKIKIPKDAFVDNNGNGIKGEVEIRYREMHDAVDFFLSGIPMTYDSAGKQYTFESAGMLEMYAFQNGEVVKLKEGKNIKIEMASGEAGNKFNVYKLDTAAKSWVYKGKDEVKPFSKTEAKKDTALLALNNSQWLSSCSTQSLFYDLSDTIPAQLKPIASELKKITTDITKIQDSKPILPKKVNPERYTFNIEVEAKEFPELAVYKNLLFELGEENKTWKVEMGKMTWEDATIAEYKKGESYMLTLKKGKEKHKLIVYPVFEGDNYSVAKEQYEQTFKVYNEKLSNKKQEEKKKQAEYDAMVKKMKEEEKKQEQLMTAEQKKQKEQMKQTQKVMDKTIKVVRVFNLDGFGTWNCDSPQNFPKGGMVTANFTDELGNTIKLPVIYQVDRNLNALFSYYEGNVIKGFKYNPESRTIVWAVTMEGKLAIANEQQFSYGITSGTKNYKMKIVDVNVNDENEIRKILNFGSYALN